MTTIAVLADIHGNYEALEAVCGDLAGREVDRVVCLGDYVGYGPDPEKVVALVRWLGWDCLMGNHDFALGDLRGRRWLNFQAAENNERTEELLSAESLAYLAALPVTLSLAGGRFVHGFPPRSLFLYLSRQSDKRLAAVLQRQVGIAFVGHTHRLLLVEEHQGVQRHRLDGSYCRHRLQGPAIVSAGSVGQPRDGDNRAKYLLWEPEEGLLSVCCVDYDREKTIARIKERGFPSIYGARLR